MTNFVEMRAYILTNTAQKMKKSLMENVILCTVSDTQRQRNTHTYTQTYNIHTNAYLEPLYCYLVSKIL